jgi:hypothetical protein
MFSLLRRFLPASRMEWEGSDQMDQRIASLVVFASWVRTSKPDLQTPMRKIVKTFQVVMGDG